MDVQRESRPLRRKLIVLAGTALAVLAGAASLAAVSRVSPLAAEVDRDSTWIGTVERGPLSIELRAPGRLVPKEQRWVTAPADGIVERLLVQPGHRVDPETVLIELSNRQLQRELLEAELTVRSERAAVSAAESRLSNEVLDLEATLSRLRADLEEAELKVAADERLDAEGLISPFEVKVDRFRAEELRRRHAIEKQRLARRQASIGTELAAEEARLERAEGLHEYLRREAASLSVRVQVGGIVTEVLPDVGSRVRLGDPLARVIDPRRLRAELDLPQARAREIRVGQAATVDTRGAKIDGRVVRIDPAVRDGVVRVDVDLAGELPAGARSELRVDGLIRIEELGDVLHLRRPMDAREGAAIDLFRLIDGTDEATRVRVELGRLSVTEAQVLSGLQAGDRVILSDTSALSESDRIRIR